MSSPVFRQYISPNCTLSLQGFSDDTSTGLNPVMSVVTQVQCQIVNSPDLLHGGLTLLDNLIKATSAYTQQLLSGLNHQCSVSSEDYISIEATPEKNRHLLIWKSQQDDSDCKLKIELSTIQLFDLLNTLDQFCQDESTLPQLQDHPQPLSRRHRTSDVSLVEQSTPVAIALVSVVISAIVLYALPHPNEVRNPNEVDQIPINSGETFPTEEER